MALDLDAIERNTAHLGQHETIVKMCDEIKRLRAVHDDARWFVSVAEFEKSPVCSWETFKRLKARFHTSVKGDDNV